MLPNNGVSNLQRLSSTKSQNSVMNYLKDLMSQVPDRASLKALKKWQELGPLNLQQLVFDKKLTFEPNYKVQKKDTQQRFYQGQVDNSYNLCGIGRDIVPGGDVYEGQLVNNKAHGYGRKIFKDGNVLVGYWQYGVFKVV